MLNLSSVSFRNIGSLSVLLHLSGCLLFCSFSLSLVQIKSVI